MNATNNSAQPAPAPTAASVAAYSVGLSPTIHGEPTNTNASAPTNGARTAHGMSLAPLLGYARNMLGAGYNCPALKLHGYRTEQQLDNAIRRADTARRARYDARRVS
jgi:hypothetical protein